MYMNKLRTLYTLLCELIGFSLYKKLFASYIFMIIYIQSISKDIYCKYEQLKINYCKRIATTVYFDDVKEAPYTDETQTTPYATRNNLFTEQVLLLLILPVALVHCSARK